MKKRTFLKTSSTLVTGSLLSPLIGCGEGPQEVASSTPSSTTEMKRTNWAGNLTYQAETLHEPAKVETLQQIVKNNSQMRALGTRHCFNDIADTPAGQVSVRQLPEILELDETAGTLRVGAGMSYGQICPWLHERGFAIHNLASLPHISVAGACATATHGSGIKNRNLAAAVIGMEFVDGNGNLQTLSREQDGDKFAGAVVHLGALGLITSMTLRVEPTFNMHQYVYQDLPVAELEQHFNAIMGAGYSVSLFTDYQTDQVNQVWIKSRVGEALRSVGEPEFYGAKLFDRKVHPILDHPAESCTDQMGMEGPWYERMPHFKMEFTPSSGKELQSEFFVPLPNAVAAYKAIQNFRRELEPILMISEVRTIAADDFWMSPCNGQDCVAFHFTMKQDWEYLRQLLPEIEGALRDLEARPHWGKIFTIPKPRLAELYPRLPDFQALMREYDPNGKFINSYMRKHLVG
jgi:xylitol oxidase